MHFSQLFEHKPMNTIKPLTLEVDNPGGSWLEEKREYVKSRGLNQFGAPKMLGPVTGSFTRRVLVPVNVLVKLNGLSGEQSNVREDSISYLTKLMMDTHRLPCDRNGNYDVPFIVVDCDGTPWVSEGNHRIMVAYNIGWKYLPVNVRYYVGGEEYPGIMSPDRIKQYDGHAISAGYHPVDFLGILN